jgi:hypothetical protein
VLMVVAGKGMTARCTGGLLRLLCGAGNVAKFGLHAGNMNFNIQSEECGPSHNICIILTVYFSIHDTQYNLPIIVRKIY